MSAGTITLKDREGSPVKLEDVALMSGEAVDDARVVIPEGQVEVSLTLTSDGAKTFRRITSENVGRQLAIILDNVVYFSPVIRSAIPDGRAVISGSFKLEEAKQLAVVLRSGALPAPFLLWRNAQSERRSARPLLLRAFRLAAWLPADRRFSTGLLPQVRSWWRSAHW